MEATRVFRETFLRAQTVWLAPTWCRLASRSGLSHFRKGFPNQYLASSPITFAELEAPRKAMQSFANCTDTKARNTGAPTKQRKEPRRLLSSSHGFWGSTLPEIHCGLLSLFGKVILMANKKYAWTLNDSNYP